jgi:hypothetical protein
MSLPQIEVPKYELTLPSTDQVVQFRPFTVKEEKLLLIAGENENFDTEIVNAVKQVIENCTFNQVKADELPIFDLEYIFLQIRAKSIGEVAKFRVICPDDSKTYGEVELDLSKIEVHVDDDHDNKIVIDESRNLGIVLKYPTLKSYKNSKSLLTSNVNNVFDILLDCIDHIFDGEKIYNAKDSTKEELTSFFESLDQKSFDKIKKFFDKMPKLREETEVTNPVTGVKSKVSFEGLRDFFELASPTIR